MIDIFRFRFYFELKDNPNFSILKTDIRTISEDYFKDVYAVFDLAGFSNDPSCDLDEKLTYDINFLGGLNVAKQAKKMGVKRYIYLSSCSVYGLMIMSL